MNHVNAQGSDDEWTVLVIGRCCSACLSLRRPIAHNVTHHSERAFTVEGALVCQGTTTAAYTLCLLRQLLKFSKKSN